MPVKITYIEDQKYGIPQLKKYPMPDKRHVISAIKFFNYVEPKYEKQLAKAILARIKEYGMSFDDFGVGEGNRFSKYLPEEHLEHHGILGQKWGVRRYQNPDGSLTAAGKRHQIKDAAKEYKQAQAFAKNRELGKLYEKASSEEEIDRLDRMYVDYKSKNIDKAFIKKYGQETLDEIKKYENRKWKGIGIGMMVAGLGIMGLAVSQIYN